MGVKSGDKVAKPPQDIKYLRTDLRFHSQVLLPEYGGMQVKIDDKELFMFRRVAAMRRLAAQLVTRPGAGTTRFSGFSSQSEE